MVVLRDGEARDGVGVRLGSQARETAGSVGICLGIITVVLFPEAGYRARGYVS